MTPPPTSGPQTIINNIVITPVTIVAVAITIIDPVGIETVVVPPVEGVPPPVPPGQVGILIPIRIPPAPEEGEERGR